MSGSAFPDMSVESRPKLLCGLAKQQKSMNRYVQICTNMYT